MRSTLLTFLVFIVLIVIITGEAIYHFYAPCSWHYRIDSVQHLPARCQR